MSLCKYKDIFGKPGQGVHSSRIFGMASVDLIATLLLAILIVHFRKGTVKDVIIMFIILMIISLILHKLFCVETTLTKKLLP